MKKNTTRVTAVVGTTMALVIAGTAAVSAAGPRDDDRGRGGFDRMSPGAEQGAKMPGARGAGGMRGGMGGGMRGLDADFERTERTVQTVDGISTVRTEQGVVDSIAADSLSFSLASGEAVTVAIDEDTELVGFEEQEVTNRRGASRNVVAPAEIEAEEIEAGAEVIVRSDSEDDSDFVASRIMVKPAAAEEAEEADDAEAEEAVEDAEDAEEATEDAAATDA